jgi:Glyoxalase-like domain
MTSTVSHTTIDCANSYELSEWWKKVLGYVDLDGDPNLPGHEECLIRSAETGHMLLFIEVADAKQVKNRVHLDLRPTDRTRDEEVERLLAIGATHIADQREIRGDGTGWVVLGDLEGNEFCILRSDGEMAAAARVG